MRKRVIALLLTLTFLILSLQGCSKTGKDETQDDINANIAGESKEQMTGASADGSSAGDGSSAAAMGRYMENKVELPELTAGEEIIGILQSSDKQLEVYTYSGKQFFRYIQRGDMTWESSIPGWLNNSGITKENAITNLLLGADGNLYVSFDSYNEYEVRVYILKSTDGGKTAQKIDLPYLNEAEDSLEGYILYPRILELGVTENGTLVFNEMGSPERLMLFSQNGEKLDEITIRDQFNFLVTGNTVIAADEEGTGILFYDAESRKIEKTVDYDSKNMTLAYALKEDGTLIVGDSGGIHRLAEDGTLWETTVDGVLSSLSMPSLTLCSLYVTEEAQEEYYAVYMDDEGTYSLLHYVFDKNVSSVPSKEITVYSLYENKTIRQAISLFQGQNNDVKINYVVAMGEETGNISDYIRALNTELLAGNGADILVLDGLPADTYIEKGVLEDISDVINPIEKSGELLTNISGGYHNGEKIYLMPTRFTLPVGIGKSDAVTSLNSLDSVITYIKQTGKPYIIFGTCQELFENYYALFSCDFLQNGILDEVRLTAFLENMKKLVDNIPGTEDYENKDWGNIDETGFLDGKNLFRGSVMPLLLNYPATLVRIGDVYDSVIPLSFVKSEGFELNTVNRRFLPYGIIGLNHAGTEMEISKEFISFLFTENVQDSNLYDGFPVINSSIGKWFAKENENYCIGISGPDGSMISGSWPSKEERDNLKKIVLSADMPIETDNTLRQMIIEEALPYLLGDEDINQAVSAVMEKVNLYMAE